MHALRYTFQSSSAEAILLVDANNAFNSLNRQVTLRNILHLCPSITRFLINTYCCGIYLLVSAKFLSSNEDTAQGDPLGMIMHGLATMPLIQSLHSNEVMQAWYADNTCSRRIIRPYTWWNSLLTHGPKYGYFPNVTKIYLLVKENLMESEMSIFSNMGISITSSGRCVLGLPVGSLEFVHQFVSEKVREWVSQVHILSDIALPHPQSAFSAFIHGVSNKWTYLSLTIVWTLIIRSNHWRMLSERNLSQHS